VQGRGADATVAVYAENLGAHDANYEGCARRAEQQRVTGFQDGCRNRSAGQQDGTDDFQSSKHNSLLTPVWIILQHDKRN
jgi:hypothetical protein